MEKYNPDGICQGVYVTDVLTIKKGHSLGFLPQKSGLRSGATSLLLGDILECAATYVNNTEKSD
jgi:hypothetical protein